MSRLVSIAKGKCPHCEKGDIFISNGNPFLFRMPKMKSNCEVCGHSFHKEPGYFFGAMYVSYALAVAEMIGLFIIAQFFVSSYITILMMIMAVALILSTINFKYARIIWMYIFEKKAESPQSTTIHPK
ncbi:DUF983 domain-containing protein [Flavobacterium sp. '19STA2R22 D10 B1']|uniref:DUF983 domain-containing protein n=1 Tax=Flavobacterium aerium TaxID=3037261 RepID=UPI00278BCE4A|nr:DUF983 domain-containing protein [Flavobacterium sp. '19STA2R22 D10 B1']